VNLKIVITTMVATGMLLGPVQGRENTSGSLHPVLQSKIELPPGWQEKLILGQPLDETVFNRGIEIPLGNNPAGVITIRVEHRIIRVVEATREVVDIF
jgi:hypothetical protein